MREPSLGLLHDGQVVRLLARFGQTRLAHERLQLALEVERELAVLARVALEELGVDGLGLEARLGEQHRAEVAVALFHQALFVAVELML